jgi:hypothetical protein
VKLLYVSPIGKKVDLLDRSTINYHSIIDLDIARHKIKPTLQQAFVLDLVEEAAEIYSGATEISSSIIANYDVLVCDISSTHGAVMFTAGLAESLGKPVIYIVSDESSVPAIMQHRSFFTYSSQSISSDFLDELIRQVAMAKENPDSFLKKPVRRQPTKAFISYCHKDRHYLDRLQVHLKPLAKAGLIDTWVDTRIKAGDRWKECIQQALDTASIAILMISADFLASEFIVDNELPPLLSKAQVNGTRIVPILLSPSRFSRESHLNVFQSINSPSEPLSLMSDDEREVVYDKLAQEIEQAIASKPI